MTRYSGGETIELGRRWRVIRLSITLAACIVGAAIPVEAQSPARDANVDRLAANPINCWWKVSKNAVHVGEPFGLTLSCRVIETDRLKAVPNLSTVEPTAIDLKPFEVLEGARYGDIVAPPWRYLQYLYTVRLLGEEFFGRDIAIPATTVTFRIQTGDTETLEGTEHRYVLPSVPVRILSLLPAQAADIQDPRVDSFADLEAQRFRATMESVAGAIFFGFAAVLAVVGGFRVRERFRKTRPIVAKTVPIGTVLAACVREVHRVRAEALRDGWTSNLAVRALAPFRVAGAIALQQPITQTFVAGDTPSREGQLGLRHGMLRRKYALVSASITADAIDRLRTGGNGGRPIDTRVLDQIREALVALSAVRYGRLRDIDVEDLDRTLDNGCSALQQLRMTRLLPPRAAAALPEWALVGWRR
jgi:hypothetical protein